MGAFCLICMNYVWRTVSIAVVSAVTCAVLIALTAVNTEVVEATMDEVSYIYI